MAVLLAMPPTKGAGRRVGEDGQERVKDERDDGRPLADASDERERDEEAEKGETRDRLHHVREPEDDAAPGLFSGEADARRDADEGRRRERDGDRKSTR